MNLEKWFEKVGREFEKEPDYHLIRLLVAIEDIAWEKAVHHKEKIKQIKKLLRKWNEGEYK
jgi:hypothetical protein